MTLLRYSAILPTIIFLWPHFALCLDQKTIEESRAIALADWSMNAKPSMVERAINKTSYEHFFSIIEEHTGPNGLKEMLVDDMHFGSSSVLHLRYLADFEWADIDGDGQYELLGVIVYIRGMDRLYVIKRSESMFRIQRIEICYEIYEAQDHKFADIMEDIDQDGKYELLLPVPTDEDNCLPFWTEISEWNGQRYQDASERFCDYYRDRLLALTDDRVRKLSERLEEKRSTNPSDVSMEEAELAAEQLIRDRMNRFIGEESSSGFERAKKWAESENWRLRILSMLVFEETKNKESIDYLRLLSKDPHLLVAEKAKRMLAKLEKRR
jgi:hypothetical protein